MYLRPIDHPKTQSAIEYKSLHRQEIVAKGYRLVLNVRDQMSDLLRDPQAEHSVKLPDTASNNPTIRSECHFR